MYENIPQICICICMYIYIYIYMYTLDYQRSKTHFTKQVHRRSHYLSQELCALILSGFIKAYKGVCQKNRGRNNWCLVAMFQMFRVFWYNIPILLIWPSDTPKWTLMLDADLCDGTSTQFWEETKMIDYAKCCFFLGEASIELSFF